MPHNRMMNGLPQAQGLYRPDAEHDACGVGFVASLKAEKSYAILKRAMGCVCNLMHRGALDADAQSGDGAGVLTQIPHELFRREIEKAGGKIFQDSDLGVGMFFLPPGNRYVQARIRHLTESVLSKRGLVPLGWREVPVNMKVLGHKAEWTAPRIEQILFARPHADVLDDDAFENTLFMTRKEIETRVAEDRIENFYIASMSCRTIVYKGMLTGPQLERFYLDLQDENYRTALVIFHQRYSTNTFPTWGLAHPFRMLAHNGEINTIRGNRNWVHARESEFQSGQWGEDVQYLKPILQRNASDSCNLDNALEALSRSGRGLLHSMMMLVPAAYRTEIDIDPAVRGFYEYHGCLNEPWDGPAALSFTDGRVVAACLDRNGLRPARYKITSDGTFLMSSEAGVGHLKAEDVIEKGRLAPGEIIAVDTAEGRLLRSPEIKQTLASRRPYADWLKDNLTEIHQLRVDPSQPSLPRTRLSAEAFQKHLAVCDYNAEEFKTILEPMVKNAQEPIGSMGDDTPLAVLSRRPRLLYHYFRQLFAQVTNPPIDPIREKLVMSTNVYCGRKRNWLDETPEHAKLLRFPSPVLLPEDLQIVRERAPEHLASATLPVVFPVGEGEQGFEKCLGNLVSQAGTAVDEGKSLLILSDFGTDEHHAALPMLLAVAAVHHHLIREGKRMRVSLLCETAEARDVHQFACLIGYGASAVCPYLLFERLAQAKDEGAFEGLDDPTVIANYRSAVDKGLLKIMSKMGISLLSSYKGAQVFEAIGLGTELIRQYFTGTASVLGGIGIPELAEETLRRHAEAYHNTAPVEAGFYRYRRDGELHAVTPPVLQSIHTFVGLKGEAGKADPATYQKFVSALKTNEPTAIRHLLKLKPANPVPLEEVEPVEEIRKRFISPGMSLGALSPEAHEAIAIAMNRIGGKSNCGEGGEDRERFLPMENGDSRNSKIKQIASGRFGVTAEYLASASEIEIKISQGAKPGEGGQLPGHKVTELIARLRHSTPGVMLISPPPHHDIYSIEDLAQLIYDLKQVNPRALVCVKLVASTGVGTIAAGVAKAHADVIHISGHDGGTGASPLSSVKHAGSPWELGVAETQQTLLLNGLRDCVILRADGGLRTGMDIVTAALLGAEEFTFGTMALLSLGCVYVRQCHLNNCPTGIATQDEKLRKKFHGSPDAIVEYFNAVAGDVRQLLANLGARTLEEIIGHPEYLEPASIPGHPKANTLNLQPLLYVPPISHLTARHNTWERNDKHDNTPIDRRILQDVRTTFITRKPIHLSYKVRNVHRSIGTRLSGAIAYRFGEEGLPDGTMNIHLQGSAGQSLGAFLARGVRLTLEGEANDYTGKGLCGGEIILIPNRNAAFDPSENIICGNTTLYGATSGRFFARGRAGERFAVRNSGAVAVVEGVGDHACEYMTGGVVVVLGSTGKNFAGGMSGGTAYVLDEAGMFERLYNADMVCIHRLNPETDSPFLKEWIQSHVQFTQSPRAQGILDRWDEHESRFWKVQPR